MNLSELISALTTVSNDHPDSGLAVYMGGGYDDSESLVNRVEVLTTYPARASTTVIQKKVVLR